MAESMRAVRVPRGRRSRGRSRFVPDDWPSAMQIGAMADTYPYGNYAGDATAPVYSRTQMDTLW